MSVSLDESDTITHRNFTCGSFEYNNNKYNPDAVFLYPGPCEKASVSNFPSVCKKRIELYATTSAKTEASYFCGSFP